MKTTTRLRQLIGSGRVILAPGAYDGVSARLIERHGFEAAILTGFGHSCSHLGKPDVGLMTLTETVERLRNLVDAVSIPVICDADTGYGGVLNVIRTVKEIERAGGAAAQLEDQLEPKKCGSLTGHGVIGAEEMVAKIKAAVDARRDPDFVVIGRTDAKATLGLDEALRRANLYREAGADVIYVQSAHTREELATVRKNVSAPLEAVTGPHHPPITLEEFQELGYSIVCPPLDALLAAAWAVDGMLATLKATGSAASWYARMMSFKDFNEMMGLAQVYELEARYAPPGG